MRGAPGATDGTAQVYLGVFSPARETYQVSVPGGALLSAPLSGDVFGGEAGRHRPRHPPGRAGQGPQPLGRLRLPAGDPGRDRHDGPARPGRPRARRRPDQGHDHERIRPAARKAGGCPRIDGRRPEGPRTRPDRKRGRGPRAVVLRPGHLRQDRRLRLLSRPGTAERAGDPAVRPPHDHRPADLRPDVRHLEQPAQSTGR